MHIHLRIQRWVVWWFSVGAIVGAIMVINIVGRQFTHAQEVFVVSLGVIHWLLGGLVCYSLGGVTVIEPPPAPEVSKAQPVRREEKEWHSASEFVQPGSHKHFLPHHH
jgi:hypothetical protein